MAKKKCQVEFLEAELEIELWVYVFTERMSQDGRVKIAVEKKGMELFKDKV